MAAASMAGDGWYPWIVAAGSGFEVRDPSGAVGLVQIDRNGSPSPCRSGSATRPSNGR